MKILLTGGGSGGHIMPILAVVDKLKKIKNEDIDFLFIGPESNFNKVISDKGIKVKTINAGKLRRYISIKNFIDIFKIPLGIIQSLYIIYNYKPDIVFSKGGYASVPPVVAAWIYRVPVITHESDIVPGLANKIISKLATKILVSFSDSKKYFKGNKVVLTGNPLREEILSGNKERAKNIFNLKENIPTILILGGSQGAKKINEVVLKMLPEILKKVQVIHICGKNNYSELKNKIEKFIKRYKLYSYLNKELKEAYTLSDIIISRAGANTLSEIITLEKSSIIIPLPTSANNHQLQNAEYYSQKGMTILIKEQNLSEEILKNKLLKLLQENDFRDSMTRKIKKYNSERENAAMLITKEILDFSKNNKK